MVRETEGGTGKRKREVKQFIREALENFATTNRPLEPWEEREDSLCGAQYAGGRILGYVCQLTRKEFLQTFLGSNDDSQRGGKRTTIRKVVWER